MKIGLVGYKGSGKSTLFEWLTGVHADPAHAHTGQGAMATIAEPRLAELAKMYGAKKITPAALEIVDTPGLSRTHEGNAARLAVIREAGCLVFVVAAFDGNDPLADIRSLDEDLLLADMEIVSGRLQRVAESLKKPLPRAEKEQLAHEEATLTLVLSAMNSGNPLRQTQMSDEQRRVTRAFRLFSEKPRMAIVNTAEDEPDPQRFVGLSTAELPVLALPASLELELARMSPQDRAEFEREMGLSGIDRQQFIRKMLEVCGLITFITANEKEVRAWLLRSGGTALEAAECIHTDLARGFIRAEVTNCDQLLQCGSEREAKARHLVRQEPKDYVVQQGDVILIRFSV